MLNCIIVGTGGFIGTVLRYLIGLIPIKEGGGFPIKTLAINLIGAFSIGLIAALASKNASADPRVVLLLKVGVCGGFTTFSTFAYETAGLLHNGSTVIALAYAAASVVLCVAAVSGAGFLVK